MVMLEKFIIILLNKSLSNLFNQLIIYLATVMLKKVNAA